jgi:2-polyprenyl-3-methyl-5-hydroxy-6-metoxy-1,4-benzoquinol methylase
MSSEQYFPERASASQAQAAVLHTRNKIVLVDFASPTMCERAIRWLWYHLSRLRNDALGRSRPSFVFSEQLLENALLLREVDESVRKVLDFGGFESTLPLALAAIGVRVTVVDQRRYPFQDERVQIVQHDILQPMTDLPADFDLVYSISTIEHVGLGGYGDPRQARGDALAVAHLWEKVRPGGRLFFSVPAGEASEKRGYRIYSPQSVRDLLPAAGMIRYFRKVGRKGVWRECSEEVIARHRYESYYADAPVEGVAIALVCKPSSEASAVRR